MSSCPARGLESASDPRTSSRIQGRRTRLPKPAIPAAVASRANRDRVSRGRCGPRLSSEEETYGGWAGPEVEVPPMSVPARAHERVLVGKLFADPCWFNCMLSCLLLPEHLSKQRPGVCAVLQDSCGTGQEGAKGWLRWSGRDLGPEAAAKGGPSGWLKATSTPVTPRSSAIICCDSVSSSTKCAVLLGQWK